MNNKCQISRHWNTNITTICLAAQCLEKRVCCQKCIIDSHSDHIDQIVDFHEFFKYITTQSEKPSILSQKVKEALQELNDILKHIEDLTKLIKEEIKRLSSANLQEFCKNISNQYNIFKEQISNAKCEELAQYMLFHIELQNGEIIEKDQLKTHLGKPYSRFMKQFQLKITAIINELKVVNYITDPNPFLKLTVPYVLKGHSTIITAIALCERKNLLLSGAQDGSVILWSLINYSQLKILNDSARVNDVALSSQGSLIAYCGVSIIIKLTKISDILNGEIVQELKGHTDTVNKIIFSEDEKYLISGSNDYTVRIWNVISLGQLFKLYSGSNIYGVAISRDNTLIAVNSNPKGIQIWNFQRQELLYTQQAHSNGAGIQFSNDKQLLVASGPNGIINMWNITELNHGKLSKIKEFKGTYNVVDTVLLTSCCRFIILYCYKDKQVQVIDSHAGKPYQLFELKNQKVQSYMIGGLAISNNLDMIAYGDENEIQIWKKG